MSSLPELEIPAFLRRLPALRETPLSELDETPLPDDAPRRIIVTPAMVATGGRALRGRDDAAFEIVAAVRQGADTVGKLRKLLAWPDDKLRSAIRRAIGLHLLEKPKGLKTYTAVSR